ncbi:MULTISPECIES: hypothetical protein [unclassified Saccharicrinis]|uniref:hypothetical protein n=1 Tax=unclassified Saccharicrinis TaxID=2646859 RepID=UPI003D32DF56
MKNKLLPKIVFAVFFLIVSSAGLFAQKNKQKRKLSAQDSLKVSVKVEMRKQKTQRVSSIDPVNQKEYDELLFESEALKEEMKKLSPDDERYKEIMRERKALRLQLNEIVGKVKVKTESGKKRPKK